jgi:general stress protein 26
MSVLVLFFLLSAAPQSDRVLDAARATMKSAQFCFLITVDDQRQAQARILNPFDPEPDMKVWLGTNRNTRKVGQIRKNPRVTLAYWDAAGSGYVTMIGRARLVDSIEERKKRWKTEWMPFYPGGPEGDTYLLIEFTPTQIEVMSGKHQIASEPLSWKPAILVRHGAEWELQR